VNENVPRRAGCWRQSEDGSVKVVAEQGAAAAAVTKCISSYFSLGVWEIVLGQVLGLLSGLPPTAPSSWLPPVESRTTSIRSDRRDATKTPLLLHCMINHRFRCLSPARALLPFPTQVRGLPRPHRYRRRAPRRVSSCMRRPHRRNPPLSCTGSPSRSRLDANSPHRPARSSRSMAPSSAMAMLTSTTVAIHDVTGGRQRPRHAGQAAAAR